MPVLPGVLCVCENWSLMLGKRKCRDVLGCKKNSCAKKKKKNRMVEKFT